MLASAAANGENPGKKLASLKGATRDGRNTPDVAVYTLKEPRTYLSTKFPLFDSVVTSTLVMERGGRVGEYAGGYTDWVRQRAAANASRPAPVPDKAAPKSAVVPTAPKPKQRKLSHREAAELDALPGRIDALEAERAAKVISHRCAEFAAANEIGGLWLFHHKPGRSDEDLIGIRAGRGRP